MPWQDLVFSIGGWIFVISLIPTIHGSQKPALATSLLTAGILASFFVAYISLGLWMGAIANGATGVAWAILAYQRWRQPKQK